MNPKPEKLIYTFGTSTRTGEEFIEPLLSHKVAVVADVRRFPSSRFEYFRRENLAGLMAKAGIDYIYLGNELGGYRRGGYQNFTNSPQFQAGLRRLEEIASLSRVAIVCAERFPWRCHRRFIALELEKRGWQVEHIIGRGRSWVPGRRSAVGKRFA